MWNNLSGSRHVWPLEQILVDARDKGPELHWPGFSRKRLYRLACVTHSRLDRCRLNRQGELVGEGNRQLPHQSEQAGLSGIQEVLMVDNGHVVDKEAAFFFEENTVGVGEGGLVFE
jgi:hypothetical protein